MHKNKLWVLLFIILALLPVLSLLHPGLPWTHDGQDQVARIANFYQNLIEGNLIPRWAENLNWGYGHPILEFLYPLPSYIASFFHLAGLSLVDSVKIVFGLGMVLSLLFMYLWLSQFCSKWAALFGAVLYTYAPYRFVDLYVRGDIGENLAFAFLPLVLFFLYKLYKASDLRYSVYGGISLALFILAHNSVSLMFMPVVILYSALLIYLSKDKKSLIISHLSLIILGFLLSAFFWVPALLEGKYTLRNIVTKGGYLDRFVSLGQLIYGPWNYGQTGQFTVQFGPFQWLAFIMAPLTAYMFKKDKYKLYFVLLLIVSCLLSIFIMLPVSNFLWSRVMLLQNFQFPWRFLGISLFSTAVLGALLIDAISNRVRPQYVVLGSVLIVLVISSFYWMPKGFLYKPESFYSGVYYGTTDTGESAPIWSVRFMEHTPKAPIQVISGQGKVRELDRKVTYRLYSFSSSQSARVVINTLYFPNWEVLVDGNSVPLQFQDPQYRGLITFNVPAGNHTIQAEFKDTKLREVTDFISAAFIFLVLIFFVLLILRPDLKIGKLIKI